MIETKRLKLYAASKEEMEAIIASQTDEVMKTAYTEMLDGSLQHPDQWEWYAIWIIELKDGTRIGEFDEDASGVAELLDRRLGDAETVDTVAEDVE